METISPKQREIYTLVQSGTNLLPKNNKNVIVSGNGTDSLDNPSLINRARRKTISRAVILMLIDIAKEKGDNERVQQYWNSYHCQSKIYCSENKLYGNYCKNRFCTVCCAIRKADIINRYFPTIKQWQQPYFITLTVKAVKAHNLNRWIKGMNRAFKLILNRCKKRHQRKKGIKLIGIKSLECNFNPNRKTYNPHFHIIVPNKQIADLLKKEWMQQWNKTSTLHASSKAQFIRKVENLERDLIETIKYGSKIFTEPDIKNKKGSSFAPIIYAKALDNIFVAMKSQRIFDRFGFNLPQQKQKEPSTKLLFDFKTYIFNTNATDWINQNTGEYLTGYSQPIELQYLLKDCVNKQLD
jgi:plasmid rolling circle replication initiator protein Rep